jgi:nucleolar protein 16
VERDPETGKIMRVIHSSSSKTKSKPLNDPLNSDSEDEKLEDEEFEGFDRVKGDNGTGSKQEKSKNEIIQRLEEQAQRVGEKKPRRQSEREKEWIERLVERWGEDYAGMVRDRRLNPMQQTEGDIRRRVGRWREDRRVV